MNIMLSNRANAECMANIVLRKFKLEEIEDPEKLQEAIEKNISSKNMEEVCEEVLFTDSDRGPKVKLAVAQFNEGKEEAEQITYEDVVAPMVSLALHRAMNGSNLFNFICQRNGTGDIKGTVAKATRILDFLKDCEWVEYKEPAEDSDPEQDSGLFYLKSVHQLNAYEIAYIDCMQSNIPMVCAPNKISLTKTSYNNGYKTLKRGVFSKKATPHQDVPVDFINIQNEIEYLINERVYYGWLVDHPFIPERSEDDTDESFNKKKKAAEYMHWKRHYVITMYKKLGVNFRILTQLDFRGRNYPIASVFNPQGQDTDKGLFRFRSIDVTEEGKYWLKVSIANCMNCKFAQIMGGTPLDLDKLTFEERVLWFNLNFTEEVLNKTEAEFDLWIKELCKQAESPACLYGQAWNYWEIYQDEKAGKVGQIYSICHFDATASGYQLQSIFAGDAHLGKLVNLTSDNKRYDLYTYLYKIMVTRGLPDHYTRYKLKKMCFIPYIYNGVRTINELFGSDTKSLNIFMNVFDEFTLNRFNRKLPKYWNSNWYEYQWELPDGMRVYKKNEEDKKFGFYWNGIKVFWEASVPCKKEYSCELGPNITHSIDGYIARELARAFRIDMERRLYLKDLMRSPEKWTYKDTYHRELMKKLIERGKAMNLYSLRILNELCASNADLVPQEVFEELMNSLPKFYGFISEIHDSFGVLPNFAGDLMEQYRINLVRLAKSRAFANIVEQLGNEPVGTAMVPVCEEHFIKEIANSKYALC